MSAAIAERFVTSAILINIPIAVWAELTHNELAEHIDTTILAFFACEIAARIVFAIKRKRCETMLVADALIVLVALSGLPLMRAARLAHLGRHVHVSFARGVSLARRVI
jgi:hypothetical protein